MKSHLSRVLAVIGIINLLIAPFACAILKEPQAEAGGAFFFVGLVIIVAAVGNEIASRLDPL